MGPAGYLVVWVELARAREQGGYDLHGRLLRGRDLENHGERVQYTFCHYIENRRHFLRRHRGVKGRETFTAKTLPTKF